MLSLSRLCGAIRLDLASRPDFIHACNCRLCRTSGAHRAYCPPSGAMVSGDTRTYRRTDKAAASAAIHFCGTCGATTRFRLTDDAIARLGDMPMGVNRQLADARDLAGIERRYPDGAAWAGVGHFACVRPAEVIGGTAPA